MKSATSSAFVTGDTRDCILGRARADVGVTGGHPGVATPPSDPADPHRPPSARAQRGRKRGSRGRGCAARRRLWQGCARGAEPAGRGAGPAGGGGDCGCAGTETEAQPAGA